MKPNFMYVLKTTFDSVEGSYSVCLSWSITHTLVIGNHFDMKILLGNEQVLNPNFIEYFSDFV